ncbi:hypothetical protein D3C80_1669720 [compost metagenome]
MSLAFEEPHGQNPLLPLPQFTHGFAQGNFLNPRDILVFVIADLVHNINRVSPIMVDRFEQGDRVLDRIQCENHILFWYPERLGNFKNRRLPRILIRQAVTDLKCFVGDIPQRTRHPDRIIIPEVPADFTDNHRHCISGELHILR